MCKSFTLSAPPQEFTLTIYSYLQQSDMKSQHQTSGDLVQPTAREPAANLGEEGGGGGGGGRGISFPQIVWYSYRLEHCCPRMSLL